MKKQIIAAAFLAAASLSGDAASAQNDAGAQPMAPSKSLHSFIGITGGFSTPIGNFGKGDYLDNTSGYASGGGNVGITGVYFIHHSRFGVAALVSFQGFGFKGGQSIADGYKDGYSLDSTTLTTSGSNHSINVLIGPYYSIPVLKHFTMDVRVLGGLTSAHRAGYHVAFEDADYNVTQLESGASAFGFQAGIAPRYNFGNHISLMLNLDYFTAKPNFNVEYTSFNPTTGAEGSGVNNQPINKTLPLTYKEAMSGINANLTLCYRF